MINKSVFVAKICLLIGLALSVVGCDAALLEDLTEITYESFTQPTSSLPERPVYVLANFRRVAESPFPHELYIIDGDTWQIWNKTPLLPNRATEFSRDPTGRIWIGYGGGPGEVGKHVEIYSREGVLLKRLEPCVDPYRAVTFSDTTALIPCNENGFYASVASVDLETLEVTATQEIRLEDETFLLVALGSNGETTLMWGGGQKRSSHLALVDIDSLSILAVIPTKGLSPREMEGNQERYFLPNAASVTTEYGDLADLGILNLTDPPTLTTQELPQPSPLWSTLHDNQLYSYHNAHVFTHNRALRERYITRMDVVTGETEEWQLPNNWSAEDIVWYDGKLLLTRAVGSPDEAKEDGLYAFDLETGELTQLLYIPGARRIVVPD